ncbi:MAG: YbaK/EbsC family protein, partial [Nocardioides sp.]
MPDDIVLPQLGGLASLSVSQRPDLVAEPVARALATWPHAHRVAVVEIDPAHADTAAMVRAYAVPLDAGANCVVVAGRRGGDERIAACLV